MNFLVWKLLLFWLKFHWKLFKRVQLTTSCRTGNKTSSEPIMAYSLMNICVTRPQRVKSPPMHLTVATGLVHVHQGVPEKKHFCKHLPWFDKHHGLFWNFVDWQEVLEGKNCKNDITCLCNFQQNIIWEWQLVERFNTCQIPWWGCREIK